MSEYEMTYLIGETAANTQAMLMNIFSIVSAYLVVAYLAAHKLTKIMVTFVNGLFISMMLVFSIQLERHVGVLNSLVKEAQSMAISGDGLEWHPSIETPLEVFGWLPLFVTMLCLVAMIGALAFFFHARWAARGSDEQFLKLPTSASSSN